MNLKSKLSEIHLLLFIKMIPYMLHEYWVFTKHLARCEMSKYSEKLLTDILMNTHALEKAFSLGSKKKGFGVQKSQLLVAQIERYIRNYKYSEKLNVPISLLIVYLNYQKDSGFKNSQLDDVDRKLLLILSDMNKAYKDYTNAGYILKTKEEMIQLCDKNYKEMALGRYSFRHFGEKDIPLSVIEEAINIAKKAPSACNRQGYKVHVFGGEMKNKILSIQGGANSFYKEADKAILITGNLFRYYTTEMHLPYIDASLFAMSLIHALTFLGIATIPLTLGRKLKLLNSIMKEFNIPQNEVPVLLIAIGNYPDKATVSLSHRCEMSTFTTFH